MKRRGRVWWWLACLPVLVRADLEREPAPTGLRMNQVQVIGTHNSYHLEPSPQVVAWKESAPVRAAAPALANLAVAYSHRPLTEQLERLGVRQLEIDIYPSEDGADFPVLHQPVFDDQSTVPTLRAALAEIACWSRTQPRHVPVLVQIELKTRRWEIAAPGVPGLRAALAALPPPRAWDEAQLVALERAILAELPRTGLLPPAEVQGSAATLRDAILTRGWPELEAVRGKVWLALDNEGELRDRYLAACGDGRLLFVSVPPEHPAAAWLKLNDPVKDFDRIVALVARGFIVRTRADEELREARANDGTRRERALTSGAQVISTDFPEEDPRYPGYAVQLPGRAVAVTR